MALIVTSKCADLLAACLDSLMTFAPDVEPRVVVNETDYALTHLLTTRGVRFLYNPVVTGTARDHAEGIEHARRKCFVQDADTVILMDNDVVVTSPAWRWMARSIFAAWGGRHAYDPTRIHAHMFAMARSLFDAVETFHARDGMDTAGLASRHAHTAGPVYIFGREADPRGWFAFPDVAGAFWWHLGSGTHAELSPRRRAWTHLKAACGADLARKALRRDARKRAFLAAAHRLVTA